jgi:metal-dependent amidase/aminoacylase/carboxypeptidase family protein
MDPNELAAASLGIQEALTHLDPASIDAAVVTVTVVAAHGSRPHLDADAILAAGHHLVALARLDRQLRAGPTRSSDQATCTPP